MKLFCILASKNHWAVATRKIREFNLLINIFDFPLWSWSASHSTHTYWPIISSTLWSLKRETDTLTSNEHRCRVRCEAAVNPSSMIVFKTPSHTVSDQSLNRPIIRSLHPPLILPCTFATNSSLNLYGPSPRSALSLLALVSGRVNSIPFECPLSPVLCSSHWRLWRPSLKDDVRPLEGQRLRSPPLRRSLTHSLTLLFPSFLLLYACYDLKAEYANGSCTLLYFH